jgi:hypothetical protein
MKNYGVLSVLTCLMLWGCENYQLIVIDPQLCGLVDNLTWNLGRDRRHH